jgi:hypothetical protein
MGNKTKVKISIKGSPKKVLNALQTITNPDSAPTMRQADFRAYQKRVSNA